MKQSRTYASYRHMRDRCLNPNSHAYPRYGGRGIQIDPAWDTFARFLADMGERPEGTSLDRIDNNANYGPTNCRWATPTEQRANQRERVVQNGKATPIGVHLNKCGRFVAMKRINKIYTYLGSFATAEEASEAYQRGYREM